MSGGAMGGWLGLCGRGLSRASASVSRGAAGANRVFVFAAESVERSTMAAARATALRGAALVPAVAHRAGRIVRRAGRVAQSRCDGDCSVLLESIGPASERTARIVERMGAELGGTIARGFTLLLGAESEASVDSHTVHRTLGRLVSGALRDGLEAMPVARSIVSHATDLRRREREQRRRVQEHQKLTRRRR